MTNKDNLNGTWEVPDNLDVTHFDFTWRPDPYDPPYIHQFGTQWQKTGGPRYVVPGATQIKYIDSPTVIALPNKNNWIIDQCIDESSFDFSWHPEETEPPFIYQFGTQWQKTGGPRYVVQGATDIKYVDIQRAVSLSNPGGRRWRSKRKVDFDWSWHHDESEPPFIYVFATQWHKLGGPRYVVPGATQIKYMDEPAALALPDQQHWKIPPNIDVNAFDWSWYPDETGPPFIYQFGTQWQRDGGPRYIVEGATEVIYVEAPRAVAIPSCENWRIPSRIDEKSFDWSWHPAETEPPFIYQFGTQWQHDGGPQYVVSGATQIKYMDTQRAIALPCRDNWIIDRPINEQTFDWSWHPAETDPPFIYQFATQWQRSGGPQYLVPGATQIKYMDTHRATAIPCKDNWTINQRIDEEDFDFSWHPDSTHEPYRYAFGNQYRTAIETQTVIYETPGATQFKYMDTPRATLVYDPLTLVYVSNGEPGEELRYAQLCEYANRSVKWVRNVVGRENALRHAAAISETDWVLVFPGKLAAHCDFDFNWQPNRYHERKHYIFYAVNPVNDLCYGHMAAVAYNCELLLETTEFGLDLTMSKLHDIVPHVSGTAQYNVDPLVTWRTAFREAIKLQAGADLGDTECAQRLQTWINCGTGNNSEYSMQGAQHGVEYYREVGGNHQQLMHSFDWQWLNERYRSIYNK